MDWSVTSGTLTRCMDLPNGINMSSSFFGLCPSALITETILALSETKVLSNQQPIVGSWKTFFVLVVLHNIFQKSSSDSKLLLGCLQNASKSSGKWGIYNPDEIPEVDEKRRSSPRQLNNPTLLHFEEKEKRNFAEQIISTAGVFFWKGHPSLVPMWK